MKVVLYLIYAFAQSGMTSAEMLQRTYLRFNEEEAIAKRARAQICPGDWSMVKRVELYATKIATGTSVTLSLCLLRHRRSRAPQNLMTVNRT